MKSSAGGERAQAMRFEGAEKGKADVIRLMASNFLKQGVKTAVVQAAKKLSAKEVADIAQVLNA